MNLSSLITVAQETLRRAGVPSSRVDVELIIAHVLKTTRSGLYLRPDLALSKPQLAEIERLLAERARRIPLQLILGGCEFMGFQFRLVHGVFIPRPETEILVEAVKDAVEDLEFPGPDLIDIGTGCGVIAISLARLLEVGSIVATDISPVAMEIARQNAILNGVGELVRFVAGDALEFVKPGQLFDVVVSNPPYIRTDEITTLEPEVRDHDPRTALDGGCDGLRFFERVVPKAASLIKEGGFVAFEIGADQAGEVERILKRNGFDRIVIRKDLGGRDRVIMGKRL